MPELWRAVPGTAGRYEVSDAGRVRSRVVSNQHGPRRRATALRLVQTLNTEPGGYGYRVVHLSIDRRRRCALVHNLVLEAFVGPRPGPAWDGAHLNGDREDNRLANLRWCTKKENAGHKLLHAGQAKASGNAGVDLT